MKTNTEKLKRRIRRFCRDNDAELVRVRNCFRLCWAVKIPRRGTEHYLPRYRLTDGTYCIEWGRTLRELAKKLGYKRDV